MISLCLFGTRDELLLVISPPQVRFLGNLTPLVEAIKLVYLDNSQFGHNLS